MTISATPWTTTIKSSNECDNDGTSYVLIEEVEITDANGYTIAIAENLDDDDDHTADNFRLMGAAPDGYRVAQLARDCRRAQRAYFADRTKESLVASKQVERELDVALTAYFARLDATP